MFHLCASLTVIIVIGIEEQIQNLVVCLPIDEIHTTKVSDYLSSSQDIIKQHDSPNADGKLSITFGTLLSKTHC